MNVVALDAYALVAFLADEPAGPEVAEILRDSCVMSTVNLAESLDVLGRVHNIAEDELRSLVDPLLAEAALQVDVPTGDDHWVVARLRTRYYDRSTRGLSLADCFLLATANRLGASVATADPALAETCRDESLELIALADSSGARPDSRDR
jgi:PIN domain nuclease of toxin-antitoxin system